MALLNMQCASALGQKLTQGGNLCPGNAFGSFVKRWKMTATSKINVGVINYTFLVYFRRLLQVAQASFSFVDA